MLWTTFDYSNHISFNKQKKTRENEKRNKQQNKQKKIKKQTNKRH